MTQTDITLLLADAADEVEIGIAPVEAVLRGGRRRRARRWAVAAVTAAVIAGSTGTLAAAGLLHGGGDGGGRGAVVATHGKTPEQRHVYEPQVTSLAKGMYKGKTWSLVVQFWGAPKDKAEATRQLDAMTRSGVEPAEVHKAADLIGKTSFFVLRSYDGERGTQIMFNTAKELEPFAGTDMESMATRYAPESESGQLVVGMVAKTAREVTCTWKNGTSTVTHWIPAGYDVSPQLAAMLRPAAGSTTANWFVCRAPEGTSYASAEVTK
ncbi:hypothetical protein ABZ848_01640 [Streptomyces sp. NPDC047081]|uniref:hypothetical protein n=1 Tax=Streptomyces sp. NPDC047081 TaxID=3154706 RepID=UPI0033F52E84